MKNKQPKVSGRCGEAKSTVIVCEIYWVEYKNKLNRKLTKRLQTNLESAGLLFSKMQVFAMRTRLNEIAT